MSTKTQSSNRVYVTSAEFWDDLNKHDWFHGYSDDRRARNEGESNEKRLLFIAREDKTLLDLFDKFHAHHFSGEAFGTFKTLKPNRPKD